MASTKNKWEKVERYKKGDWPIPEEMLAWPLYGAGFESLGVDDKPVRVPVPEYGPDELLVRHDAVGLCFSDIKIISLGPDHPRIMGRDMKKKPVIMGHEVSMTVVGVGENLRDKYKVGDRFVIQADIYFKGKNLAYGYLIDGGLSQYNVIGKEILEGDEGCYLIPVKEETGYAESALTEPWACVEASYSLKYRRGLKPDGIAWFIGGRGTKEKYTISRGMGEESHPRKIVASNPPASFRAWLKERAAKFGIEYLEVDGEAAEIVARAPAQAGDEGFDDIVVLGPDADIVEEAAKHLAREGILAILADRPLERPVNIDVGRIHYDHITYVGAGSTDVAAAYETEIRSAIKKDGKAWFVGAGGPMGRMHVQRNLELPHGSRLILVTDISEERLRDLEETYGAEAKEKGVELICLNPAKMGPEDYHKRLREIAGEGFDDVQILAPVAALTAEAVEYLAPGGVLDIFAGLARGTMAKVNLSDVYSAKQIRIIGSTASSIDDLRKMLYFTETGQLSPNRSVAAIASLSGAKKGLVAVRDTAYPGKIVIFPNIGELELTSLPELKEKLPTVYARLKDGRFWTDEAEEELLRKKLPAPEARILEDRIAIVTGAGQGLGEALAHRLAKEGAHVALFDINLENAQRAALNIEEETDRRALAMHVDVTNEEQVMEAVEQMVKEFGRLDIMVANAGILVTGEITELPADKWRKVIEVNLTGYFLCAKAAARIMKEQRRGVIIQINSKSGKKGSYKNSAYAASKFGGIGLTQSIALELAPYNVRVNAICPGNLLDSPLWVNQLYDDYARKWGISKEEVRQKYISQVPMKRGCTYEDVANVLVFLASDQASYMTGQAINVTGGEEMR